MPYQSFPLAMDAPKSTATPITTAMLGEAVRLSRQSPRKRIILKLHKKDDAPLHRMLNAMQPGTLFRAHRHLAPPKQEVMLVLRGALRVVLFDELGHITSHHDLRAGGETFGFDIEPEVYHTLIVLEPDTVMLECKNGPYTQASDKSFPAWAPEENTPEAKEFLSRIIAETGGIPEFV